MHFCQKCGNMFYLRLKTEESDELIYYCRNCGEEDHSLQKTNLYVSKKEVQVTMNYKNKINKYTKLDPTLPRITTIDCPNSDCKSNKLKEGSKNEENEEEKEILYIRYDDKNMKFVYLCAVCDNIWKTENK